MLLQSCLEQRDEGSIRYSVSLGYLRGLVAGLKGEERGCHDSWRLLPAG